MKSKRLITSLIFFGLFLALIILVKFVDVGLIIGSTESIGLYTINSSFHKLTGVHMAWYNITDLLGLLAIAVCGIFAIMGLMQLVKRKGLLKVDKEILSLGVFYIVLFIIYFLFEIIVINVRPIIMPGESSFEASFPSSHTMLVLCVIGSSLFVKDKYINKEIVRKITSYLGYAIMFITIVGRAICGVHWLTDIIGGILISISLLCLLQFTLEKFKKNE